jgi:hypothetical protein
MSSTVAAVFSTRLDADRAVDDLVAAGFTRGAISLLVAESSRGQHFKVVEGDKAAEGAIGGSVVGGTLGALAAGLVAIGIIVAPGIGLIAAGPLLAALAGLGAGAAAGGLVGGLVGLGIPEHHAKVMDAQITRGGILVAVGTANKDEQHAAEKAFADAGAVTTSNSSS